MANRKSPHRKASAWWWICTVLPTVMITYYYNTGQNFKAPATVARVQVVDDLQGCTTTQYQINRDYCELWISPRLFSWVCLASLSFLHLLSLLPALHQRPFSLILLILSSLCALPHTAMTYETFNFDLWDLQLVQLFHPKYTRLLASPLRSPLRGVSPLSPRVTRWAETLVPDSGCILHPEWLLTESAGTSDAVLSVSRDKSVAADLVQDRRRINFWDESSSRGNRSVHSRILHCLHLLWSLLSCYFLTCLLTKYN